MIKRKVIAYFTDEDERDKARGKISQAQETKSFLFGEAEEDDIQYLRRSGLVVETLEERSPEKNSDTIGLNLQERSITEASNVSSFSEKSDDKEKTSFYTIQLEGPII